MKNGGGGDFLWKKATIYASKTVRSFTFILLRSFIFIQKSGIIFNNNFLSNIISGYFILKNTKKCTQKICVIFIMN